MNVGERQRKLSLWSVQRCEEPRLGLFASKRDLRLYDLYHLVCEPTWLREAHNHVARNAGSITAGCDGITMSKFDENLEGNLQKLVDELKTQTYRPHPVRRVYIPKKDGKLRPLGIPSIRDRIVQESLRMVLEPVFEAEFYDHSYGFRPNRCTMDALAMITHRASRAEAEAMKQELQEFLVEELKLTLSDEKTKITHINDGFRFLGYEILRDITGTGVKLPKLLIPQEAVRKVRAKILAITAPSTCRNAVNAKIHALNMLLRGWGNYYRYAYNASRVFAKLDSLVVWQFAHWLGSKFKCQMPTVFRRFFRRVDGRKTFATDDVALVRLMSLTFEQLRQRIFDNPYATPEPTLERAEVFGVQPVWQGNETRPGIEDLRVQVYDRDHWICQHCGVKVTHATARLDHILPVKHFARPEDANGFYNLQTLCIPCHTRKTTDGE